MAQLLFTGIRCSKDAHTEISFRTTRVSKPDKDEWKKLKRLSGCLKRTISLPMILKSEGVNVINWWVDASYAVHEDMRGHIGRNISMERARR